MEDADPFDFSNLGPLNEFGYAEGLTAAQARMLADTLRDQMPAKAEEFDAIALRIEGALN